MIGPRAVERPEPLIGFLDRPENVPDRFGSKSGGSEKTRRPPPCHTRTGVVKPGTRFHSRTGGSLEAALREAVRHSRHTADAGGLRSGELDGALGLPPGARGTFSMLLTEIDDGERAG